MVVQRVRASVDPVARVALLVPLAHLDREFDYQVAQEQSDDAQPGVRVRVRFAGRLVDGFVLERAATSGHAGSLGWLDRVVSSEPVLTPEVAALARAVAARTAGVRADVLRLAVPPRHARVEAEVPPKPTAPPPPPEDLPRWAPYPQADGFLAALREGRAPRAAWQALPGEDWPARLAEAAAVTVAGGRSAVLVVPDQRDVDRVHAACARILGEGSVVALAAGLGPAVRYRRWLAALRGQARVVVGPRAAAFAPVTDVGLVAVWDDGDDNHAEPRAPYPHSREVAVLRAHAAGAGLLVAGHARTAEVQALVESGYARDLLAPRAVVRERAPRTTALADTDEQLARDPAARAARIPAIAFAAARAALAVGAPVLVQVPRRGYVPALSCARCREPARCRRCHGPLALPAAAGPDGAGAPVCRWCGVTDTAHRCTACGGRGLRATVVGARRTAEELGRAFAGVPVRTSGAEEVLATVPASAALVVATPGAEPVAEGGYGAALLLDGWALLGRADLRAGEEALRRWMAAAALVRGAEAGGQLVVVAESELATVQALVRWDPVGHAAAELASRAEVGFPPAVAMAALDGVPAALEALVASAELPAGTEVLGPVDSTDAPHGAQGWERLLLRAPRAQGRALAGALAAAQGVRSAHKEADTVRVQVDPHRIG
ncbi:primosomal protein N' [Rhodococcus antarcticus]|uniref:Probable replication restart protein PriA n=1 Tax=Rhodococcus antarcticus TaxID=2987751 RepID=A0ABY6P3S2_9NOCA|nr:primosomal protein N' [Rhodococcus antarcticus]UZJ26149.1 primosomal protein N' [Rhodococcus antarcticus]